MKLLDLYCGALLPKKQSYDIIRICLLSFARIAEGLLRPNARRESSVHVHVRAVPCGHDRNSVPAGNAETSSLSKARLMPTGSIVLPLALSGLCKKALSVFTRETLITWITFTKNGLSSTPVCGEKSTAANGKKPSGYWGANV